MREVIRRIVNVETYGRGVPNWTRRHVRKLISERVAYNEQEWRPLGAETGHSTGGGHREASLNVEEFGHEFSDSLHTIPADDGHVENYRITERYDKARVWTCEVREWSRRQARATREANKEAEASGKGKGHSSSPDTKNRDQLLGSLLAKDPVWQDVITHRKKKGPNLPVTDEEREALGTRAESHTVGHSARFYKVLQKWEIEERYQLRQVENLSGGGVPPWFPDLKECQKCIIGAAYAASDHGYPLRKPVLACFNKEHYLGEAASRRGGVQAEVGRPAERHRTPRRQGHPGPEGGAAVGPRVGQVSARPGAAGRDAGHAMLAPPGIPSRRLLLRRRSAGDGEESARHNRSIRPGEGY